MTAVVLLLSTPLALVEAEPAEFSWLLIAPLQLLAGRALVARSAAPTRS